MKTEHTPGPWGIQTDPNLFNGKTAVWGKNGHGTLIAVIYADGAKDSIEANAKLIAAAPKLLAACKKEVIMLTELLKSIKTFDSTEAKLWVIAIELQIKLLKAAIAEATE